MRLRKQGATLLATSLALTGLTAIGRMPAQAAPVALESLANSSDVNVEATRKLIDLLKVDTTNPPGNEAAAAQLVADWLKADGIESRLYESAPGRVNLVARLKGTGEGKPLLLLNHLDVVLAEPSGWSVPPFSGNIVNGAIWGRGSLDMKGLGIMELMAFLELKRRHVPLKRDVILCCVADEEAGGKYGAEWMLNHHPEEVACSELLNEGGAGMMMPNGAKIMGIQTAERGNLWMKVTATGKPGHGSQDRPDGATRRLIRALARLETVPRKLELLPQAKSLLKAIGSTETGLRRFVLDNLDKPFVLDLIGPTLIAQQPQLATMLATTWNTTVLSAGSKVNVMPGEASAEIDMRMLPNVSVGAAKEFLQKTLAEPDFRYEELDAKAGSSNLPDGELFAALAAASQAEYPGVVVSEILTPGGMTDSSFFRQRGMKAYGLMPSLLTADQLASMHGDNEYITVEQLARGTRVLINAVLTMTANGN